ncbi:MAG: hypothetical protein HY689_15405 [Chloroflexi bacterium]|nr:hypothetical protein [Chloroflexota bacterium]
MLRRSVEQVHRYLREGKLRSQRIGNQWFVDRAALPSNGRPSRSTERMALLEEVRRNREVILREAGCLFDGAELVRASREERHKELDHDLS